MASTPEEFDLQEVAGLSPPFFVRKVDRATHWTIDEDDSSLDRIDIATKQVFPSDRGRVSVFSIQSAEDLLRVSIGLNSHRSSLREKLTLLCVLPSELEEAGLNAMNNVGDTKCDHANQCHRDIDYDENGIRRLIGILMNNSRSVARIGKSRMNVAIEYACTIGCRATETTLPLCQCCTPTVSD